MQRIKIQLDISEIDRFPVGSGYSRYVKSVLSGFNDFADERFSFILTGSEPEAFPDLGFSLSQRGRWSYEFYPPKKGRGRWFLKSFQSKTNRNDVDLYHGLYFGVPFQTSIKTVATVYDLIPEILPEYENVARSRAYRWNRWLLERRASGIIAISDQTRNDILKRWRVDSAKIRSIPIGTSFGSLLNGESLERKGRNPGAFTISSPYNLEPRKNLFTLLEAIARLKNKGTRIEARLFGKAAWSAEREAHFKTRVAELGIEPQLVFLGILNDEDLAREMVSADLFAYPSIYEGFGLPILEAMACGACIIANDQGAMREVLGNCGWVCTGVDVAAWESQIEMAIKHPEINERFRIDAKRRAAIFTIRRMTEETLRFYEEILSRN